MPIRSRYRAAAVALIVAAALVAVLVVVLTRGSKAPSSKVSTGGDVTIPAGGGTSLAAHVYLPAGRGRFPLIVMPGSWGSSRDEYAVVGADFARLGYLVVAYAQRGFGGSTGSVDLAGPATQADVGTVIDWARAHTSANDGGVALVGASYGAGVALLAAEHDPRVRVVAALSGWADLAQVLAPGGTPNEVDAQTLFEPRRSVLAGAARTYTDQLAAKQTAAALATLGAMAPSRSPDHDVRALDANRTAVFLSSTYEDSLLPPSNLVDFYDALTGPKQLVLGVGDHGANALAGLQGHKSALWVMVAKWVARYIGGTATGDPGGVQLTDAVSGATHDYTGWAATGAPRTLQLGPATGAPATGALATSAAAGWSDSLSAGVATISDAGPPQFTTGRPYTAPTCSLAGVSRTAGAVWSGATLPAAVQVSGRPTLHVTVASSAATASVFAYLYDVDPAGTGRLISYGARSVSGAGLAAGEAVDVGLGPIAWTVAAGHHLALVVDSVDTRYLSRSVPGSTISLSSTPSDPATLSVPVG